MAGTREGKPRANVEAYVGKSIPQEFILRWRKLRDDSDKLTNLRTMWTRAFWEHCANVYDEEQRAIRIDQAQHTRKHVREFWLTLGITQKAACSKIRATGKMFKSLPVRDRELIIERIPASKDALYAAATHDGADLRRLLQSSALGPESTTAQFRQLLDKATPQDRTRNAKLLAVRSAPQAKLPAKKTTGLHRVTVICQTRKAVTALLAFVESQSTDYSIEAPAIQAEP